MSLVAPHHVVFINAGAVWTPPESASMRLWLSAGKSGAKAAGRRGQTTAANSITAP